MKAIIIKDKVKLGEKKAELYLEEVPVPKPDPGEILVRLKTAALNRRDVFIRYGNYPGIKVPAIPGADGAGIIAKLGEGVEGFQVGNEVLINPGIDWGNNPNFPKPTFSVLGVPINGTYAQYTKVPAENVFIKPAYLSWEAAAALPLAGLTAYRSVVTKGSIKEEDTVIIPGIGGGVALFALQIAVGMGAKVYVTSSSNEKIEKAVKLGALGGVNYRNDNWVKELKLLSGGADLLIDSIGGDTFNDLINLAKQGGKIVSFGATLGSVNNLVMPKVFLKQLTIMGSTMGTPKEFAKMLAFCEINKIEPVVSHVYQLEEADEAYQLMESGSHFGKIVLSIPE